MVWSSEDSTQNLFSKCGCNRLSDNLISWLSRDWSVAVVTRDGCYGDMKLVARMIQLIDEINGE